VLTDHAHPGLVAVRAGVPDAQGRREFSSGLLVAPRLVLTARHGVVAGNGACRAGVEVQLVTGPRGGVRLGEPVSAEVAWQGRGDLDGALLRLPDGWEPPGGFVVPGLAWGEPVGNRPVAVTVTGLPGFAAASTGEEVETVTTRGNLEPGTYTGSDRYAVDLTSGWPQGWRDWAGVSGAAVRCEAGGHLIGVVAWSDKPLEGRRLTAVPVRALLGDARFCEVIGAHLEMVPDVEPVELAPFLARPQAAGSLGGLLRADAALVGFTGRADEIEFLERWRDLPASAAPDVKALLVTGRGGEGKTRLAVEFLARSKHEGWAGGMLRLNASLAEAGVIADPARRLLLVIDYAAARGPDIGSLIQVVMSARPRVPVRLLLLARATGQWWQDLAGDLEDDLPGLEDQVLALSPLLAAAGELGPGRPDPPAMFTSAAGSLAPHLARFTGRAAAELRQIAACIPVPDLSGPGYAHVLTVQLAALVALLQQCDPIAAGGGPEDLLLGHEQKYRDKLARARGLDDVRLVRDRAVAGAALFGARGPSAPNAREAACAVAEAALAPDLRGLVTRQRMVAGWIAELYPPDDPAPGQLVEYWGAVLPDRLGEFLVIRLLADEVTADTGRADPVGARQPGLLESLAGCSDAHGARRALLILSRAAEYDMRAAAWIERLVRANPRLLGAAALEVGVYAESPVSLRSAMVRLGITKRDLFREIVASVQDALPRFSVKELEANAGLTRELTVIYRELAAVNRDVYLPDLATSLNNHAARLADTGRRAEAVAVSEEALRLYRELATANRDTYLPNLATSLNNHASMLAETGQRAEAVAVSEEAVRLSRELAAVNRDAYLPNLATSVNTHAAVLAETGQRAQAVLVSVEAVALRRELAAVNRDAYLPFLATSLSNHAALLAGSRRAEAVAVSEEAVRLYRELAAVNRDVYLPDLAITLNTYALLLAETGRHAEAVAVSEEAVRLYRELAVVNRDAYLPFLATSLNTHAGMLAETGQRTEAVAVSEEAVRLYRELTALNRDAYLPIYVLCLSVLGHLLLEDDRVEDSLSVSITAILLSAELPDYLRNRARRAIATLRQAYGADPDQAEATFRELTGDSLPHWLK